MAKALRDVREKISLVDLVLEIRDARVPLSSGNPAFDKILKQKPRLIVLNKANLADSKINRLWTKWFSEQQIPVLFVDALNERSIQLLTSRTRDMDGLRRQKYQKKGIQPPPLRMMVLGIPNTGKSTLINRMTKRRAAERGDRPGVTRNQEWIVLGRDLELLDTPGIMPPRIEREEQGMWLSAIYAVKEKIVAVEKLAAFVIDHLLQDPPGVFLDRYRLRDCEKHNTDAVILSIADQINARKKGGEIDYQKTCTQILHDFRKGLLGPCSFETPPSETDQDIRRE